MWLELTMSDGSKELFNMALCFNVEPTQTGALLRFIPDGEEATVVDVMETVADLKIALNAVGKPA